MSGYLQRLFDRGAGWSAATAGAANEVAPATAPGSPTLAFDQRLADPGLAALFGILGVSPDPDALAQPDLQGEEGVEVTAPARAATASLPVPPPGLPRAAPTPAPQDVPARQWAEATQPPPMRQPRPAPLRAEGAPPRGEGLVTPVPRSESGPATLEPTPWVQPRPALPRATAPVLGEPQAQPVAAAPTRFASVESAPLATPPAVEVAPAPTVQAVPPSMPQPSLMRAQTERTPVREVEPPRRAPEPLAPPAAAAPDARQVERIARDVVRAELAARPAAPAQAPSRRAATAASAAEPAPRAAARPASAREASVIGELEPSSSPLTIYGLRRR